MHCLIQADRRRCLPVCSQILVSAYHGGPHFNCKSLKNRVLWLPLQAYGSQIAAVGKASRPKVGTCRLGRYALGFLLRGGSAVPAHRSSVEGHAHFTMEFRSAGGRQDHRGEQAHDKNHSCDHGPFLLRLCHSLQGGPQTCGRRPRWQFAKAADAPVLHGKPVWGPAAGVGTRPTNSCFTRR